MSTICAIIASMLLSPDSTRTTSAGVRRWTAAETALAAEEGWGWPMRARAVVGNAAVVTVG